MFLLNILLTKPSNGTVTRNTGATSQCTVNAYQITKINPYQSLEYNTDESCDEFFSDQFLLSGVTQSLTASLVFKDLVWQLK